MSTVVSPVMFCPHLGGLQQLNHRQMLLQVSTLAKREGRRSLGLRPLTLYGNGSQTRSFCYLHDLIEGMIRLMNVVHCGLINIGKFTIRQLVELVRAKVNPQLELIEKPLPQDDPLQRQPVIDLAQRELVWKPRLPLEQVLKGTTAYFKDALS